MTYYKKVEKDVKLSLKHIVNFSTGGTDVMGGKIAMMGQTKLTAKTGRHHHQQVTANF